MVNRRVVAHVDPAGPLPSGVGDVYYYVPSVRFVSFFFIFFIFFVCVNRHTAQTPQTQSQMSLPPWCVHAVDLADQPQSPIFALQWPSWLPKDKP